jgi:hypothetical protein
MVVHSVGATVVHIPAKVCSHIVAVPTAVMYVFLDHTADIKQVNSVELKVNNGHLQDQPHNQDQSLDLTVVHVADMVATHSSANQAIQAAAVYQHKCTGLAHAVNLAQAEWFL